MGALVERARTALGRKMEVSMLDATAAFSTEPLGKLFASGKPLSFYSHAASSQPSIVTCKDALGTDLAQALSAYDRAYRMRRLKGRDVAVAPQRSLQDLVDDPQVKHLGLFFEATDSQHGLVKAAARRVRFDVDNCSDSLPPPSLGEDACDVLHDLGLNDAQIEQLIQQRVN